MSVATTSEGSGRLRLPAAGGKAPGRDEMRELRRFFSGRVQGAPLPEGALPASFAPFRDPRRMRNDYPLLLDGSLKPLPLTDLLRDLAREDAGLLSDHLPDLERHARKMVAAGEERGTAAVVRAAGERVLSGLDSGSETAAGLADQVAALAGALPPGELLDLTPDTPRQLLSAAASARVAAARSAFRHRVESAAEGLRGMLAVEAGKDLGARQPDALGKALGSAAGRFLDPEALAKAVGPHRGSARAQPKRRQRLQTALSALEEYLARDDRREELLEEHGLEACIAAGETFDRKAGQLAEVVRAVRMAELELRSAYDPERHDPLLAELDWQGFTTGELHVLPAVLAVTRAEELARTGILALSRLLLSGRPVHVLVLQSPARDPAADSDERFAAFRMELAYLAVAHREAWVQQSTAARPSHLLEGYVKALAGTRAALHVVDTGLDADGRLPALGAFLHAGAAIEGRAHPLFHYDPEAGETWARRLHFDHNPQPAADWPTSKVTCEGGEELELAFTFADFALLEPTLRDQFSVLPDEWTGGDLVPLVDYLTLAPEDAARRVPWVWVADEDGALHRAAVRRSLVLACSDRLRFWHTLQELAGVRSEYVREAVAKAREEIFAQAANERQALEEAHRQEVERVRNEAVGAAMQNLACRLLDLEPMAMPAILAQPPQTVPSAAPSPSGDTVPPPIPDQAGPEQAEQAEQAEPEADGGVVYDEPWIETARCSSCNDCINLNPLLFVYDENKQAKIGDPSKGTFAELVKAAEKCPVRCIHPGRPRNPDERNLERLIARAAPFNQ